MLDIEYIDIEINNMNRELIRIIPNELKVILPQKEFSITEEKIHDLLRIIRNWDNYQKTNNLLDAEEYKIKIKSKKDIVILQNKGTYPENYNLFKKWMGEIYDR